MPRQFDSRWTENPDGSRSRRVPVGVPAGSEESEANGGESYAVPRTHAEADEQASERGVSWPREDMTVQEKQEYLSEQ